MRFKKRYPAIFVLLILISILFWQRVSNDDNFVIISSSGPYSIEVGEEISIPVYLDVKELSINAAKVIIFLDSQIIQVKRIDIDESVFTIWIDDKPSFSNDGKVTFEGGLPNPGFSEKGLLGTVIVEGKSKGSIKFGVDESSKVFLNDGLGTEIPIRTKKIEIVVE